MRIHALTVATHAHRIRLRTKERPHPVCTGRWMVTRCFRLVMFVPAARLSHRSHSAPQLTPPSSTVSPFVSTAVIRSNLSDLRSDSDARYDTLAVLMAWAGGKVGWDSFSEHIVRSKMKTRTETTLETPLLDVSDDHKHGSHFGYQEVHP